MVRLYVRAIITLWLMAHPATVVRGVRRAGRFRAEVAALRDHCPQHFRH